MSSHDGKRFVYNGGETLQPSFLAAGSAMHAALFARIGHLEPKSTPAEPDNARNRLKLPCSHRWLLP